MSGSEQPARSVLGAHKQTSCHHTHAPMLNVLHTATYLATVDEFDGRLAEEEVHKVTLREGSDKVGR